MRLHPPAPRGRRRSITAGAAVVATASLLFVGLGTLPASAAELTDVISDVNVTPTEPALGSQVRTDISWCVPDGTQAGDTFSLTLSEYLRSLPNGFALVDPADPSRVVATAAISDTDPAVVTFTMSDYAESHTDVCGTAFIESGFDNGLTAGETVPFDFVTNDGTEFTTPVTPTDGGPPDGELDAAFKFGALSDDQGHTDPQDAVTWFVVTPVGPLDRVVISDDPGDGMNVDCPSVDLLQGTRIETNITAPVSQPTIITAVECSADAVSVTVGPIPAGQAVRLSFRVDLDAATGQAAHTFSNTANVVSTAPDGSVRTDTPSRNITSSTGGGGGEGESEPSIDIEKWATDDGYPEGDFDTLPGKAVEEGVETPVTFTITNDGREALTDVTVGDTTDSGPDLAGLSCDFSPLGGPATGTTWTGPLEVGAVVECTGVVPGLDVGGVHSDTADVVGTGIESGRDVDDSDPFSVTAPSPEPAVDIVKGDDDGNAADTEGDAVTLSNGATDLLFTVTNAGTEPLVDVQVSDRVVAGGTVSGLSCTFPDGTTGTTWVGPFAVGDAFDCTAALSGVAAGSAHQDVATVTGTGVVSGTTVDDDNPYFAKRPAAGLAVTGADGVLPAAWLALGFLLAGAAVFTVGRRRIVRD